MVIYKNKESCIGCGNCSLVCPTNSISLRFDEKGFVYPKVNDNTCVQCGSCKTVCPTYCTNRIEVEKKKVFSYSSDNEHVLANSSSGGMFSYLCEVILKKEGYVCGAVFNDSFEVEHIVSDNPVDIDRMRKAKYSQSQINDCFAKIKILLEGNKPILFSGTPCQVLALKTFLRKDYDNLYTVDLVCSGVPSPLVFNEYKRSLCKKYGEIKGFSFRDKKDGWEPYFLCYEGNNGKCYSSHYYDPYMQGFLRGLYVRPSCENCIVKETTGYCSDLTIGDFWGIKSISQNDYKSGGVSAVLPHTEKGFSLLKGLNCIEQEYDKFCNANPKYKSCMKKSPKSEEFYNNIKNKDFRLNVYHCLDTTLFKMQIKIFRDKYYGWKNRVKKRLNLK